MTMLWVDVETTSLDVGNTSLLEVGLMRTDRQLNILESASVVVRHEVLDMEDKVRSMHTANGLIAACLCSPHTMQRAEVMLVRWYQDTFPENCPVLLSDNAEFDLGIIKANMPLLAACFGHRVVDVSHVRRLARLWFGFESAHRQHTKTHRVLDCLKSEINELYDYRSVIFKSAATTAVA